VGLGYAYVQLMSAGFNKQPGRGLWEGRQASPWKFPGQENTRESNAHVRRCTRSDLLSFAKRYGRGPDVWRADLRASRVTPRRGAWGYLDCPGTALVGGVADVAAGNKPAKTADARSAS
jgi:hypothetical protein